MAVVRGEYAPPGTDLAHAVRMLLVHDIVEIDAGDPFAAATRGAWDLGSPSSVERAMFPKGRCARAFAPVVLVALVAAALAAGSSASDNVHPVSGRVFAPVMSHVGAEWLDRWEREREERPSRAVKALALRRGAVVADVGAGSGYYTERLAREVGPTGRVYATDIQPEMLALVERRVKKARLSNVQLVLGTEDDPRLPQGALDLVLLVDVYHEFQRPQEMVRRLKTSLAPGGRLVLVEFRKEDPQVPIREEHKMSVADAKLELEAEGFRLERVIDVLPWQHILVFAVATH